MTIAPNEASSVCLPTFMRSAFLSRYAPIARRAL